MAFALAALYTAGWVAMWLGGTDKVIAGDSFELLTGMYGLFIALLVGALSVAEERALGTAETQLLQPWPFLTLSLVKFATAGVIALLLGLAVPTVLEAALPLIGGPGQVGPTWSYFRFYLPSYFSNAGATILLTTLLGCYVSSLSVGGLRGLLLALPLSFSLASLYVSLFGYADRLARGLVVGMYGPTGLSALWKLPTADGSDYRTSILYSRWMAAIALAGFVGLLLFLLLRNFKSGERGISLARKQLPLVVVYVMGAAVLMRGGNVLLEWWLFTH